MRMSESMPLVERFVLVTFGIFMLSLAGFLVSLILRGG